jgi:hypothetical protein
MIILSLQGLIPAAWGWLRSPTGLEFVIGLLLIMTAPIWGFVIPVLVYRAIKFLVATTWQLVLVAAWDPYVHANAFFALAISIYSQGFTEWSPLAAGLWRIIGAAFLAKLAIMSHRNWSARMDEFEIAYHAERVVEEIEARNELRELQKIWAAERRRQKRSTA